jgi:hypothetical protein
LSQLLKREYIVQALSNQLALITFQNRELQQKTNQLSAVADLSLDSLVRLQRIIMAYESWYTVLQKMTQRSISLDIHGAVLIQQALTYDKKTFLNQTFQTQRVLPILQAIESLLENYPSDKLLAYCKTQKQSLQDKVEVLELALQAPHSYAQSWLATAILGITQQPEYQLGQLSSTLNVELFDQFSHIPVIGEPLTPRMLSGLGHAVGASFVGITLGLSNYWGYSYQMIALINRMMQAQVNTLIKLGAYGNLDELWIIEHERWLNWSAGLGIHLGMTMGVDIVPAAMGYVCGTALAEAATKIVDRCADAMDVNEHLLAGIKTLTHVITYTYAYQYAHQWGSAWRAEDAFDMPQNQAYEILGLGQYAKESELKQRYRELALQYHPDRCNVDCETQGLKMADINVAYQTLKKKLV